LQVEEPSNQLTKLRSTFHLSFVFKDMQGNMMIPHNITPIEKETKLK